MNTITVPEYSIKGEKLGTTALPENIFGVSAASSLLALAVNVYLSNQRQTTRKAQTRSEVSRTTAKIWRQKGTGRARHGSRRAHIFVGGGVAHGPKLNANFAKTLPKKMRRKALLGALSLRVKNNELVVMNNLDLVANKTKAFSELLTKVVNYPTSRKVLIILPDVFEGVINACSNLKGVSITQAKRLNTHEILHANTIILSKEAIEVLHQTYIEAKQPMEVVEVTAAVAKPAISTKKAVKTQTSTSKKTVAKKEATTKPAVKKTRVKK
jgi:large subunit ribosomal protein L4